MLTHHSVFTTIVTLRSRTMLDFISNTAEWFTHKIWLPYKKCCCQDMSGIKFFPHVCEALYIRKDILT